MLSLPLLLLSVASAAVVRSEISDVDRNTSQIIVSRGYEAEEHNVLTPDGYLITMFRIRNPLLNQNGKPVLLMHPLVGESANFLINTATGFVNESMSVVGNNLGFELSKRGRDVWLGNVRGNVNARKHQTLKVDDPAFWQFSVDQHSALDLPAMIAKVKTVTGYERIDYIGHSQGTMIMFALLSKTPSASADIDNFIALGPVAFVFHVTTPLKHLLNSYPFRWYLGWGSGQFLPPKSILIPISQAICPHNFIGAFCTNFLFLVCGYDGNQVDKERLPSIVAHAPAGTSKQNMLHYLQLVSSHKFRMFDHGLSKNMDLYGRADPPDYDLSKIKHKKISFIWAANDALADPQDIDEIRKRLTVPLCHDHKVGIEHFNHLDYIWAKDAGKLVNSKILEILDQENCSL